MLRAAAADLSHKEIAERLYISPGVVNNHLNNIYKKLNVHRPMQAVARAISMGYLDLDALGLITTMSHCAPRDFNVLDSFISYLPDLEHAPGDTDFRPLAEFGLLLLALGGAASQVIDDDRRLPLEQTGVVCEVDARGEIVRSFGTERLRCALGIAVAPPEAAHQGFAPGNLFVLHDHIPRHGLSTAEVAEFTPEGGFVRAFHGGQDIRTRLSDHGNLAFAAEGRLLVASPGLTYALLAFGGGGKSVRRFAGACCPQFCPRPNGDIYVAQYSGTGCSIRVFGPGGGLLREFAPSPAGVYYRGIAVGSSGEVFLSREENEQDAIEVYDAGGALLRSFRVSGLHSARLTSDRGGRLYVPCERTGDIKVVSPIGAVLRRIDLHSTVRPHAVALGENGRLWVCGLQAG